MADDLPTLSTLDELADMLGDRREMYVRWSRGLDVVADAMRLVEDEAEQWGPLRRR